MRYTVKALAALAGITPRTLRWYDAMGLVCPETRTEAGYRVYGAEAVDRLQQVLLYREMGFPLEEIRGLLDQPSFDRADAFRSHLAALRERRTQIDGLIRMVEKSLTALEGGEPMADHEKFAALKQAWVDENERQYGAEARQKYGDKAVDEGNQAMMNMSEAEHRAWEELQQELQAGLVEAVRAGAAPDSEIGGRLAEMHLRWLTCVMGKCTPEMQSGIAAMYPEDERFRSYYDHDCDGCAAFLRDAVLAWNAR